MLNNRKNKLHGIIDIMEDRKRTIEYSREKQLMNKTQLCQKCKVAMVLSNSSAPKDKEVYRCFRCYATKSIRAISFFFKCRADLSDSLLIMYHRLQNKWYL